jgi:hypothetical protein
MRAHLQRAGATALAALLTAGGPAACGGDLIKVPFRVPTDVVVVDLDGDGRADVVTLASVVMGVGRKVGQLQVYRQTDAGTFAAPETYEVGAYPWRVHVVDIDGDGAPDLVITDVEAWTVSWMRQDASSRGRFLPPAVIDSGLHAYDVGVADLDGDGAPDLAIPDVSKGATRLVLRYQDPARRGTFLPGVDVTAPGAAGDLVAGDLDGDGRADLAGWFYDPPINDTPSGRLGVSLQGADARFGTFTTLAANTDHVAQKLALGEVDGDGRTDLLAFFKPASNASRPLLTAVRQVGQGAFAPPVSTEVGDPCGVDDATFADLDGDGRTDVAVVGTHPDDSGRLRSTLCVLLQDGRGAFTLATAIGLPVQVLATAIAAGDLDGDGRPDLVVFGGNDPVLVLRQSTTTPGTFESPKPLR